MLSVITDSILCLPYIRLIASFSRLRRDIYVSVKKFPEPHAGSKKVKDANFS